MNKKNNVQKFFSTIKSMGFKKTIKFFAPSGSTVILSIFFILLVSVFPGSMWEEFTDSDGRITHSVAPPQPKKNENTKEFTSEAKPDAEEEVSHTETKTFSPLPTEEENVEQQENVYSDNYDSRSRPNGYDNNTQQQYNYQQHNNQQNEPQSTYNTQEPQSGYNAPQETTQNTPQGSQPQNGYDQVRPQSNNQNGMYSYQNNSESHVVE